MSITKTYQQNAITTNSPKKRTFHTTSFHLRQIPSPNMYGVFPLFLLVLSMTLNMATAMFQDDDDDVDDDTKKRQIVTLIMITVLAFLYHFLVPYPNPVNYGEDTPILTTSPPRTDPPEQTPPSFVDTSSSQVNNG